MAISSYELTIINIQSRHFPNTRAPFPSYFLPLTVDSGSDYPTILVALFSRQPCGSPPPSSPFPPLTPLSLSLSHLSNEMSERLQIQQQKNNQSAPGISGPLSVHAVSGCFQSQSIETKITSAWRSCNHLVLSEGISRWNDACC